MERNLRTVKPGPKAKPKKANLLQVRPYLTVDGDLSPELYKLVNQLRASGELNDLIFRLLDQYVRVESPTLPHEQPKRIVEPPPPQTIHNSPEVTISTPQPIESESTTAGQPPKLSSFLARAKALS